MTGMKGELLFRYSNLWCVVTDDKGNLFSADTFFCLNDPTVSVDVDKLCQFIKDKEVTIVYNNLITLHRKS